MRQAQVHRRSQWRRSAAEFIEPGENGLMIGAQRHDDSRRTGERNDSDLRTRRALGNKGPRCGFEASARVGKTSVAAMDPDVSIQMKTLPSCAGSISWRCGPPTPSTSAAKATIQSICNARGIHVRGFAASVKNAMFE